MCANFLLLLFLRFLFNLVYNFFEEDDCHAGRKNAGHEACEFQLFLGHGLYERNQRTRS